jgi:hypothetical protein
MENRQASDLEVEDGMGEEEDGMETYSPSTRAHTVTGGGGITTDRRVFPGGLAGAVASLRRGGRGGAGLGGDSDSDSGTSDSEDGLQVGLWVHVCPPL